MDHVPQSCESLDLVPTVEEVAEVIIAMRMSSCSE